MQSSYVIHSAGQSGAGLGAIDLFPAAGFKVYLALEAFLGNEYGAYLLKRDGDDKAVFIYGVEVNHIALVLG